VMYDVKCVLCKFAHVCYAADSFVVLAFVFELHIPTTSG